MTKPTNRKFQNIYIMAMNLAKGALGENKPNGKKDKEGNPEFDFIPFTKEGTKLAYAAKRFVELNEGSEKSKEGIKSIETTIKDKGQKLALEDKETKEILYNTPDKDGIRHFGIHEFRFTKENQGKYEKEIAEYYDKEIDFEVKTFICKAESLPDPMPFGLEPLNGYLFNHKFYDFTDEDILDGIGA